MQTSPLQATPLDHSKGAIALWALFIILLVILNGTIPFLFGVDLHAWTTSGLKSILFGFLFYGLLFLAGPLILLKGWGTVRQPAFLIPLVIAVLALTAWHFYHWTAVVVVVVLAYLHRRFDLSELGLRSHGWKVDLAAIALMGILGLFPLLMRPASASPSWGSAALAGLTRLFANPASTSENLFYFGFFTEQLSHRAGRWLTPPLVALMYTAHEMSNPEYWYGGMSFTLVFVGVMIWSAIYLWRRSATVIWLGDGLYRFFGSLF
jgi:hypothetical protein